MKFILDEDEMRQHRRQVEAAEAVGRETAKAYLRDTGTRCTVDGTGCAGCPLDDYPAGTGRRPGFTQLCQIKIDWIRKDNPLYGLKIGPNGYVHIFNGGYGQC